MKVFPALLEFPRKHVLNVSSISNQVAELVIEADSLDSLKAALNVPGCKLRLSTSLDARAPLSPNISVADADKFFLHRLDREITRLRALKKAHFDRVAAFLDDYKSNGTTFWATESRPTPIFMSSFMPTPAPTPAETSAIAPSPTSQSAPAEPESTKSSSIMDIVNDEDCEVHELMNSTPAASDL